MPLLKICGFPGCSRAVPDGAKYCAIHKQKGEAADAKRQAEREAERHKVRDQKRRENQGTTSERGYGTAWQKARLGFLRHHPLCARCEAEGRLTPATVVDHIVPHKGDKTLFWDKANWQPLCKTCHDKKTYHEDGGFGRSVGKEADR